MASSSYYILSVFSSVARGNNTQVNSDSDGMAKVNVRDT